MTSTVTFRLLSWGHFKCSDIIDLTALTITMNGIFQALKYFKFSEVKL